MSKRKRIPGVFLPDKEDTIIYASKAGIEAFNQAVQDVAYEQLQKKGYDKLTNQYDVTKEDIDRIVKEVFDEQEPQQRFFFYWTDEHYKMFDKAMKEYLKEQGYE